ncbi:hypothetical protein T310_2204 [Rasamsonia emersonii CBS 393.64]|uniref:Phosphatidylglycerol lysyltransferase C-terminal domain-containing protein n=1 Tax=Rasamsonia emersonii (strain ATCC 16479 / CBS 393.64 / IMI 116815) TaxID=1408163 RepID=A0A0F4YZQ4_RASE3|nr:hypothetical protein T310_2204 [Rasamsonia emersonii CBS 393.64]KKA23752.1 hypothetical protein T310_2204 [Rasamsonia emersonii CBS 393.64]
MQADATAQHKMEKKKQKRERKQQQKQEQRQNNAKKASKKSALYLEIGQSMADQLRGPPKPNIDSLDLVDRLRIGQSATLSAPPTTATASSCSSSTLVEQGGSMPGSKKVPSIASSGGSDSSAKSAPVERSRTMPSKYRKIGTIFTLDDFAAMVALESLFARYGRVSHMGILDKSYSFFVNKARTAALHFKVHNGVAIVGGDPLCEPSQYSALLEEFARYRKEFGWKLAFMGASDVFLQYAREKKWTTLQFGTERVLNPMTNPVLLEQTGKRIVTQNKQLLNESKGGISLGVYIPSQGEDPKLQRELVGTYDAWRDERNRTATTQAFITVYDPFSLPRLMTYIYTRGPDGVPNGFAALRKLGANQGYHIDPCIAAPGAPKGISDLLIFAAMALLNQAGIDYLSFGFEPLDELGAISGMPKSIEKLTRSIYRHTFQRLPIAGKKAYHDKFRPDENQGSGLHLIFPGGVPGPRHMAAMAHMANISIRKVVFSDAKKPQKKSSSWSLRESPRSSDETPNEHDEGGSE